MVISDSELLKYLETNGMIDVESMQDYIMKEKERKLLSEKHKYKITKAEDGYYRTMVYRPDGTRKMIKKKNEEDIYKALVEFYSLGCGYAFQDRFCVWKDRQRACGRTEATIHKYDCNYRKYFKGKDIEKMDCRSMNSDDITLFLFEVVNSTDVRWQMLKELFTIIRGTLQKCIIDGIIDYNPCDRVDIEIMRKSCYQPKPKTDQERTFSEDEEQAVLDIIKDRNNRAKFAIELIMYTGMRVGEVVALKWECIDFENHTILVMGSETYNPATHEYIQNHTKTGKIRTIPMIPEAEDCLKRTKQEELKLGCLGEYVFMNPWGRVNKGNVCNMLRNVTIYHDGFTNTKCCHALRRTVNSQMRENGVPVTTAASILGHSVRVNEQNYTYSLAKSEEKMKALSSVGKLTS